MAKTPFVSVIIPVFNDAGRLETCLRALERQTYPPRSYEVIVVDNGSEEDVTPILARFSRVRACCEATPGSYAARNRGLALAGGEVIAFTDSDCVPSPDWIENGVENLLCVPGCGLVAGKVEIFYHDPQHPTAVEIYEGLMALDQHRYVETCKFGATANLFTFREVFERVGMFDAEVKSGGDLEWGQRVASFGYDVVYADAARVAHPARHTLGQLYRRVCRVIGGFYDLNRKKRCKYFGIGRGFLVDSLPPLRASVGVLRGDEPGRLGDKLKIILIMFFVQYVQVWERVRLKSGGKSRR
jgi:glycosyltransferase involved in cell wall biosynthesis